MTAIDLVGQMAPMRVRLDRSIDRQKPCCGNVAIIRPGKGPHAAELRCESCSAHRGWLQAEALAFVESLTQRFGAPVEPLILRDTTIGDHTMTTERKFESKPNSGALFRNNEKAKDTDRDYYGTVNVNGTEFWASGWINTSKKGTKYLSLSLKLKDDAKLAAKKPLADDMSDSIPF
jgi:hypothetical protein